MRNLFYRKKYLQVFLSVAVSFLFVAAVTYGATTISTNINTAGTLTVTGASTLTGAVYATSTLQATGATTLYNNLTVDTSTLYVDSTNHRVGVGTTSPAAFFSVGGAAGTKTGHVYLTGGLTVGATTTINTTEGTILLASSRMSDPTGVTGLLYYNANSNNVRLYNGSSWGVIGTSTGFDLNGKSIRLSDLTNGFLTLGTTTAQGASLATLEATSTLTIPLTLVARASQTANLFQINNSSSANLLYVDSGGALVANGNVTLGDAASDAIVITGNASTTNSLSVGNVFSVGGLATTTSAGAISTGSTLTVTGLSSLNGNASTTQLTLSGATSNLWVNGFATTTSAGVLSVQGAVWASSTLQATGALTTYGNVTLGDAIGDAIVLTGNASTTNNLTVGSNLWINGNATTTSAGVLSVQGAVWASSTLQATGALTTYGNVTLGDAANDAIVLTGNASTTNALTVGGNFYVNGFATTTGSTGAIATQGSLTVGGGTAVNSLVFGYCTIPNTPVAASSTVSINCTGATGITSSYRVMAHATSSLPAQFTLLTASSTDGAIISVTIKNNGWLSNGVATSSDATGVNSFNFIGFR